MSDIFLQQLLDLNCMLRLSAWRIGWKSGIRNSLHAYMTFGIYFCNECSTSAVHMFYTQIMDTIYSSFSYIYTCGCINFIHVE